jgi:hypothetical protein
LSATVSADVCSSRSPERRVMRAGWRRVNTPLQSGRIHTLDHEAQQQLNLNAADRRIGRERRRADLAYRLAVLGGTAGIMAMFGSLVIAFLKLY